MTTSLPYNSAREFDHNVRVISDCWTEDVVGNIEKYLSSQQVTPLLPIITQDPNQNILLCHLIDYDDAIAVQDATTYIKSIFHAAGWWVFERKKL